ncbi:mechanosensitive ion channel family protein [Aestuariibacter salexigens]|uniref:mechanosensitive ion channel family protein n=1 Tax=Aestuariibacter salexigens TaxID=226010 RepID=UPI0004242FB4|nr:mechanosensitive ion channel family protein [Aestuariibacter salexigens]
MLTEITQQLHVVAQLATNYKGITTLVVIASLILINQLIARSMRARSKLKGEDKRHHINTFKQLSNAFILLVILAIWSSEVQHFAISIAAFTVAIVLATKEFIQCFLGFIYYLGAKPFRVGDWIHLRGNIMGEVVTIDWAKTALLEVDEETLDYTGKHVYIPNSQLVTQTVKNMNFLRRYTMHEFTMTFEPSVPVFQYLRQIEQLAKERCEHFRDIAERYKSLIERHLDIEFIAIDPVVALDTNQYAKTTLTIAMFCPTNEAARIQQQITQQVMARLYQPSPSSQAAQPIYSVS